MKVGLVLGHSIVCPQHIDIWKMRHNNLDNLFPYDSNIPKRMGRQVQLATLLYVGACIVKLETRKLINLG